MDDVADLREIAAYLRAEEPTLDGFLVSLEAKGESGYPRTLGELRSRAADYQWVPPTPEPSP